MHKSRTLVKRLRDLPHVKSTRVEIRKSVLASKQFLTQVLVCLMNVRVIQLKSRNVIRLFTLPCKTNNMLSDNITCWEGRIYLLTEKNHTNNTSALIEMPDDMFFL